MSSSGRGRRLAAAALLALETSVRAADGDPGCLVCHPAEAQSQTLSAHGRGATPAGAEGCVSCHAASDDHSALAFESPERARWAASLREDSCAGCHGALAPSHPPTDRRASACAVCHRAHPTPSPAARSRSESGRRIGEWLVRGRVETGARVVSVDGSRMRFRQDSDIESGPRLREMFLEAERAEGDAPSFRLLLQDLGDPFPRGALDVALSEQASASAYARRQTRVSTASDDVHAYDLDRKEAGGRVRLAAEEGPVFDLGASRLVEEGDFRATSNFNVAEPFPPAPARVERKTDSLDAGIRFDLAGFEVALRERVARRRGEEDLSFEAPNAFVPGVVNRLTRDIEDDTLALETLVAAHRHLAEEVELSIHGRYLDAGGDGDLRSREVGAFAGTDFARVERGSMDTDEEEWEIEGSLSFPLVEPVRATLFARHEVEDAGGTSKIRQVLASPPGTPNVTLDFVNATRERSVEDLAGFDLDADVSDTWALRGGGQVGQERLEVRIRAFNSTVVDREERLPRLLAYGGATWRPTRAVELHLDLQGRRYGALDEFFREATARGWEAAARTRWRASDPLAFGLAGRTGRSTVDEFEARNRFVAVEADATYRLGPALAASLFASHRDEDLSAVPTLLTFGGPISKTLDYDAVSDLLAARLDASLDARTRSETGFSYGLVHGDARVLAWTVSERLERDLREDLTIGIEGLARRYDPDPPTLEPAYRAFVVAVFARWSF